jgi:hypothetical protein
MDSNGFKRSVMAGIGLCVLFAVTNGIFTYFGENETLAEWSTRQATELIA